MLQMLTIFIGPQQDNDRSLKIVHLEIYKHSGNVCVHQASNSAIS